MRQLKPAFGIIALLLAFTFGFNPPAMAASPNNQATQQMIVKADPDRVFSVAQQAFTAWPRGEFVAADAETHVVKGLSRTKVFKFVDDITVAIAPTSDDPPQTQLSIQSVGRMGEYDFGGNQRNINEYVETLKSFL